MIVLDRFHIESLVEHSVENYGRQGGGLLPLPIPGWNSNLKLSTLTMYSTFMN